MNKLSKPTQTITSNLSLFLLAQARMKAVQRVPNRLRFKQLIEKIAKALR